VTDWNIRRLDTLMRMLPLLGHITNQLSRTDKSDRVKDKGEDPR
jgi:hypothetical protein